MKTSTTSKIVGAILALGGGAYLATQESAPVETTHKTIKVPPGTIPSFSLQPGDSVLFQRGGEYFGTLNISQGGTAEKPIYVGAYGTGASPVLRGTAAVTGWTQVKPGIWKAALSKRPPYVFIGRNIQMPSRYPDMGWLRNASGSKVHVTSPVLTQANGYWNGTKVQIRTTNYSYESRVVKTSPKGRLDFDEIAVDLKGESWGFCIEGHPDFVTRAGLWGWKDGSLYIYSTSAPQGVQVSVHEKGINTPYTNPIRSAHVKIQGLSIEGYTRHGISVNVTNNVTIEGCTIRYSFQGISASGT